MLKSFICVVSLAVALIPLSTVNAAEAPEGISRSLQRVLPGEEIESVRKSPVAGLFEVVVAGHIYYLTEDGSYLVEGDVIDMRRGKNLTEQRRAAVRVAALDRLGDDSGIVFAPEGKTRATLTVFTDVDCSYCQKLHGEMDKLNAGGIAVRYLAYPRAGKGSRTYKEMVSVWCAKDRKVAMDNAKHNFPVKAASCDNPVDEHFALGNSFGVRGTPALVTEDGKMLPGYVPAEKLIKLLVDDK